MFFDPQSPTARGVSYDTVIRAIRRAQMETETSLGIRSQLIMCFLRDWSAEFAMSTLLQSLPSKEWIIGVDRIDHGVNAIEDKNLYDEIKRRSLALTICPISNGYVVDGSKSEVIAAMLQAGMRVTVNSDDPAYFPGYMNENLIRVQEEVDLGKAGVVQLAENAFESAWLPGATKDRYIAELKAYAG
jgi:adenosine deaminase